MIVIQGEEIMRPSTSPSMGAIFTFVVRNKDKIFDAVISSELSYRRFLLFCPSQRYRILLQSLDPLLSRSSKNTLEYRMNYIKGFFYRSNRNPKRNTSNIDYLQIVNIFFYTFKDECTLFYIYVIYHKGIIIKFISLLFTQ